MQNQRAERANALRAQLVTALGEHGLSSADAAKIASAGRYDTTESAALVDFPTKRAVSTLPDSITELAVHLAAVFSGESGVRASPATSLRESEHHRGRVTGEL